MVCVMWMVIMMDFLFLNLTDIVVMKMKFG